MSDFLEELNENIKKIVQRKNKWHQFITTSEPFTGVKEYIGIGEYFERFCNDNNTGYQLWKWELDKEPIDFNLWEEVKPSGDRTQDCTV